MVRLPPNLLREKIERAERARAAGLRAGQRRMYWVGFADGTREWYASVGERDRRIDALVQEGSTAS